MNEFEELVQQEDDRALVERYRKYKKKRKIIILFIACAILTTVGIGSHFYFHQPTSETDKTVVKKKKKDVKDTEAPCIILSVESIEVEQGTKIDYKSYIEEVTDNKDKDLLSKVIFNEIDTNIVGEYLVIYRVTDKAGNETKTNFKVKVNKKKEEPTTPPATAPQPPKQSVDTNSSIQNNTPPPPSRYFLFKDGYTMQNVATECANALKESGRGGICMPLQDESGIYLGMRLDFN